MKQKSLLSIKNLTKYFPMGKNKILQAVNNISLDIYKGETLGLVGESGCGKSTLGRTILRLYEPTKGQIFFKDEDICKYSHSRMKTVRKEMQIIFQDPYSSLNPRMTIQEIIGEAFDIHNLSYGKEKERKVYKLLEIVGLKANHANRYPHEFSGGQRQRIGIARALSVSPTFIVCDEPISALDVSIQAQVVNLLKDLQEKMNLTYLFIAHDLSMVKYISDRVAVMYFSHIVELAKSSDLYLSPLHPYTQALLSAIPIPDPKIERSRSKIALHSDTSDHTSIKKGCSFSGKCPHAKEVCQRVKPLWREVKPQHFVACHLYPY